MQIDVMNDLIISEVEYDTDSFKKFMNDWISDIQVYFPHYSEDDAEYGNVLLLDYQGAKAGVFIYQVKGDELHIDVDYVAPEFRNKGIGSQFFQQMKKDFQDLGFREIVTLTNNAEHRDYLTSLGFTLSPKHPDLYKLEINKDRIL